MADFSTRHDIAVIDEIQMIADERRGYAWTNALLGLQADEIHLCGDPRPYMLIKELVEMTGDTLECQEYQRLSNFEVEDASISSLEDLRPGDCIVAFSRSKLFTIKAAINNLASKMELNQQSDKKKSQTKN